MEVQKKFLAHELSELITPQRIITGGLQRAGRNSQIAHTVVDFLAYFSVRDFIAKPILSNQERKGIKPNPNYYLCVGELFPFLEEYAEDPSVYPNFAGLVDGLILRLKERSIGAGALAS